MKMTKHELPLGAKRLYKDSLLKVDISPHGSGLFATSRIPVHVAIGPYFGNRLSDEDATIEQEIGNVYLFEVLKDEDLVIDARDRATSTVLRYLNSADCEKSQNCRFHVDENGEVWVVTTKVIEEGQELLTFFEITGLDTFASAYLPQVIDITRMRALYKKRDFKNAFLCSERHRRALEEENLDLKEKLAQEQQEVIKYRYKAIQAMNQGKRANNDKISPKKNPKKKKTDDAYEQPSTRTTVPNSPQYGLIKTDCGWTGIHNFKKQNFSIGRGIPTQDKLKIFKEQAEVYRDTGMIVKAEELDRYKRDKVSEDVAISDVTRTEGLNQSTLDVLECQDSTKQAAVILQNIQRDHEIPTEPLPNSCTIDC